MNVTDSRRGSRIISRLRAKRVVRGEGRINASSVECRWLKVLWKRSEKETKRAEEGGEPICSLKDESACGALDGLGGSVWSDWGRDWGRDGGGDLGVWSLVGVAEAN